MKSISVVLIVLFILTNACKDTSNETTKGIEIKDRNLENKEDSKPKWVTQAQLDSIKKKQKLDKYYKRAITASGDTLLPYILQDSVEVFFNRYAQEHHETVVRMSTKFGDIDIELFEETPLYRASMLFLINNGYFDETVVHRTVPGFIVQAGNSDNKITATKRNSSGNYELPPQILPNVKHGYGTVSSSKYWENNPENWHNPYDFFISLRTTTHLDGEHTIFGKVISGMDVAEKITQVDRDSRDWPLKDVYIKMSVVK